MAELRTRLHDLLAPLEQTHLLAQADQWSQRELESLLREIKRLNLGLFCRQQETIRIQPSLRDGYTPLQSADKEGNKEDEQLGLRLMSEGRCGCIILAGGQASRLRIEGPKGMLPLSQVRQKSLFQMIAEKVLAASRLVNRPLHIAVMTSTVNRVETELFFLQNRFFGLNPSQVSFFSQPVWPLLSLSGDLMLRAPGKLAVGPNGNGDVFHEFVRNGIWKKWNDLGIKLARVIPIDNPLALPFDAQVFGFQERHGYEISIQGIKRKSKEEKIGTLGQEKGKLVVAEYGEISPPQEGIGNSGLYVFSLSFMERVSSQVLPLHAAMKAVKTIDQQAVPSKPNVWKIERFIFDVFPYSEHIGVLLCERERCFAPLKNLEGEGNITDVQAALLQVERKLYEQVTGQTPPAGKTFELSSDFYYPSKALLEKWKNKPMPEDAYIEGGA